MCLGLRLLFFPSLLFRLTLLSFLLPSLLFYNARHFLSPSRFFFFLSLSSVLILFSLPLFFFPVFFSLLSFLSFLFLFLLSAFLNFLSFCFLIVLAFPYFPIFLLFLSLSFYHSFSPSLLFPVFLHFHPLFLSSSSLTPVCFSRLSFPSFLFVFFLSSFHSLVLSLFWLSFLPTNFFYQQLMFFFPPLLCIYSCPIPSYFLPSFIHSFLISFIALLPPYLTSICPSFLISCGSLLFFIFFLTFLHDYSSFPSLLLPFFPLPFLLPFLFIYTILLTNIYI